MKGPGNCVSCGAARVYSEDAGGWVCPSILASGEAAVIVVAASPEFIAEMQRQARLRVVGAMWAAALSYRESF